MGVPAYDIMPPLPGYDPAVPDWANLTDDQRHAMARKLYQEAGYSDKHPLETVLTYASGGADIRRFMEALSAHVADESRRQDPDLQRGVEGISAGSHAAEATHIVLGRVERRFSRPLHLYAALPDWLRP